MRPGRRTTSVLLLIVVGQVLAVLVGATTNVATAVLPDSWKPYLWLAWVVLIVLVPCAIMLAVRLHHISTGAAGGEIPQERMDYYRAAMIKRVRRIWISGVLEQSIYRQTFLELGLDQRVEAREHPWDSLMEQPDRQTQTLHSGADMVDLLEEHRALLILGAAGAGKTTMLLGLTGRLLDAAESTKSLPIPVVFQLASWAAGSKSLAEWLVDELAGELYGLSRDLATAWIRHERVLPLLDGLDEVVADKRTACAQAIQAFRREFGLLPLVVCSRAADYEGLGIALGFPAVVHVQPLTPAQVDQYLDHLGESLAGLRQAARADDGMWDLLQSPFLLSLAVRAYEGLPAGEVAGGDSPDDRRARLFAAFVTRTLRGRSTVVRRPPAAADAVRWLSYLARALGNRFEQVFYVESVGTGWLPTRRMRRFVVFTTTNVGGALVTTASGLLMGLAFGTTIGVIAAVLYGMAFAAGFALDGDTRILVIAPGRGGHLFSALNDWWRAAVGSVFLGVFWVGCTGLVPLAAIGALTGMGLWNALLFTLGVSAVGGGLLGLLVSGVFLEDGVGDDRPSDLPPNSGLHQAVWSLTGVSTAVGLPAAFGLGWAYGPAGAWAGALLGVSVGYVAAGRALLGYWLTRLLLARTGLVPVRLLGFLDFASSATICRRVGGGYMFHHRLLLEYFARLELTDLPARFAAGVLPGVDLRPAELLERTRVTAPSAPDDAVRALRYVAELLPAEVFAPTPYAIAREVAAGIPAQRRAPHVDDMTPTDPHYLAAEAIYQMVIGSRHVDYAAAAAVGLGDLIMNHRPKVGPDRFRLASMRHEMLGHATVYYVHAMRSGNPQWAAEATERLRDLSPEEPPGDDDAG